MVISIPLSKTGKKHIGLYEAIVSDDDSDLAKFDWSVTVSGKTFYANRRVQQGKKRLNVKLHRVIMERMLEGRKLLSTEIVDHINMNGLDNRRENLRVATISQNVMNRGVNSNNTTGALGVFRTKKGKPFAAQIGVNGKHIYLGAFDTVEEAKQARKDAAMLYHKEFAAND